MDKRFVKPIIVPEQQSPTTNAVGASGPRTSITRKDVVRKWSVRKVRKRPLKSKHTAKSNDIPEEKTTEADEKSVIVFGDTENTEALDTPLFVSSDEDSATSEDGKSTECHDDEILTRRIL